MTPEIYLFEGLGKNPQKLRQQHAIDVDPLLPVLPVLLTPFLQD